MKKIILHIGHGKTASSYIQSCLSINRELLLEIGCDYPMCDSFSLAKKGFVTSGNHKLLYSYNDDLKNDIIISGEHLFDNLLFDGDFKRFIKTTEYEVEVLLYTRDYYDYLYSLWGQKVKRKSYEKSFECFLDEVDDKTLDKLIGWVFFSKIYGFKLRIFNYSNVEGDIFKHFLSNSIAYDRFEKVSNELFFPEKTVNRSLNDFELNLQLLFNNFLDKSSVFISDPLVNFLPNVVVDKTCVSKNTYEKILLSYKERLNNVNLYLNPNEQVFITRGCVSTSSVVNKSEYLVTTEQMEVLAESLSMEIKSRRKFLFFNKLTKLFSDWKRSS